MCKHKRGFNLSTGAELRSEKRGFTCMSADGDVLFEAQSAAAAKQYFTAHYGTSVQFIADGPDMWNITKDGKTIGMIEQV